MSWMTQTEAAAALRISERTLNRRVAAGDYETKREGRNVMINVDLDDAVANVAYVSRQLAEVGAANAITSHDHAKTVAVMAEQMAFIRKAASVTYATAAIVAVVAVVSGVWMGWTMQRTEKDHGQTIADMSAKHGEAVHTLKTDLAVMASEKKGVEARLSDSEATVGRLLVKAAGDATQATQHAHTSRQLRAEVLELKGRLAVKQGIDWLTRLVMAGP